LLNNGMEKCKPIKSSTKPVLTLKDDFWVGDGADLECTIHAIDRQDTTPAEFFGEMTNPVNNQSAAQKQRREAKKRAAQQPAAHTQAQEMPSSNDMAMKQNFDNNVSVEKEDIGTGAYCVPILFQDVDDEADPLVVVEKKKANQSYNMRRHCEQ